MIKFENIEVFGWEAAIRGMRAKSFCITKNGKYETFCSNHSKSISLGIFNTEEEAKDAVFNYRSTRLINSVSKFGLDINNGIIYEKKYLVFSNGMIFNLHGNLMKGTPDRNGYIHGIINKKQKQYHVIVASCFCFHEQGKDFVDHLDGNKSHNEASNLEWVTKQENTIRSYKLGLQKPLLGEKHQNSKLHDSDIIYIRTSDKTPSELAKELNVDRSTIRDIIKRKTWRHIK